METTDDLRKTIETLAALLRELQASPLKTRERSLVITKLQDAQMWAYAAGALETK